MKAVIDNDILFKGSCYGLLVDLITAACSATNEVGILGTARFVVPNRIQKANLRSPTVLALKAFEIFLRQAIPLEPTQDEQRMAADLEVAAQRLGFSLDGGESQLCAILTKRFLPLLATGDKRAIVAMERLLDGDSRLAPLGGKVMCLEQLFAILLTRVDGSVLRSAVCSEPNVDKALTSCFGCCSPPGLTASYNEGLGSYIDALRSEACRILAT